MRILFESAGHRVSIAASVAEALSVGTRDPAALVLLDLTLPDGNGFALVEPLLAAGCARSSRSRVTMMRRRANVPRRGMRRRVREAGSGARAGGAKCENGCHPDASAASGGPARPRDASTVLNANGANRANLSESLLVRPRILSPRARTNIFFGTAARETKANFPSVCS